MAFTCYNFNSDIMKYLKEKVTIELIEKKSRFITSLIPVNTIEEVNEELKFIKKTNFGANHNCYAYILDNQFTQKSNDDGEPKGTAGIPILEALKQYEMTNVLCVVTRYFGGVLLGKGGLIRAYMNSTLEALKKASFYKETLKNIYEVKVPYPLFDTLKFNLENIAVILNEEFLEHIIITFYFNIGSIEELVSKFNNEITVIKTYPKLIKTDC